MVFSITLPLEEIRSPISFNNFKDWHECLPKKAELRGISCVAYHSDHADDSFVLFLRIPKELWDVLPHTPPYKLVCVSNDDRPKFVPAPPSIEDLPAFQSQG